MMHSCHGWSLARTQSDTRLIIIVRSNHRCVAKLIELPYRIKTNMLATDVKLDLTVVYLDRIPLLW